MFRWIGLSLPVLCACALLQGATLFAGITNGGFSQGSDGLEGWTFSGDYTVFTYDESAIIQKIDDGVTYLRQDDISGSGTLHFDLKFEFGDFTETVYFKAYLLNYGIGDDSYLFYSISTKSLSSDPSDPDFMKPTEVPVGSAVENLGDGDDGTPLKYWSIRHISIPVSSADGNFTLYYEMSDPEGDPTAATVTIDNVAVIVPEPATMTLGLIGVGVVGMIRRRMR